MKKITLGLLMVLLTVSNVYAQRGCAKDDLGRIFCAPAGGVAVQTLTGIACSPGQCVTDDLGYLKCSKEFGGSAMRDDLGRVVCVGGCVNPSKEFCKEMKGESK